MALVIPTTETVTKEIVVKQVQETVASTKEIVATIFDFRSTVGYIIINTKDDNDNVIEQQFCKVSGADYLSLIGKPVDAGVLANIVLTEVASFAMTMNMMNQGITPLDPNEMIQELIGLMKAEQ
jgi:hypothetical protein